MGEARRRANALRKSMLEEIELWMQPSSVYERSLAVEIANLPVVTAFRPSREEIIRSGMKARGCHQNCISYCQIDPDQKSEPVFGWWVKGDNYISHSVVRRDELLFCITPYIFDEREFLFIPHMKISWEYDSNGIVLVQRDGRPVELRVRSNPQRTILQSAKMKQLLLSGMDPLKAWDFVFSTT